MLAFEERKDQERPAGDPFATMVTPTAKPGQRVRPAYFEAFRHANGEPTGAMAETVAQNPAAVLDMQTQARTGADAELQKKREKFERLVAIRSTKDPKVEGAVDTMCQKAVSFILKMHGDIAAQRAAIEGLGAAKYAKEKPDFDTVVKMLQGGSIREKMMLLGTFQETIGAAMLEQGPEAVKKQMDQAEQAQQANGSLSLDQLTAGKDGERAEFDDEDFERAAERAEAHKAEMAAKGKQASVKGMFSPLAAEAAGGGAGVSNHKAYAKAKSEDHDTKLPALSVAAVKSQVPSLAPIARESAKTPGLTASAEGSSLVASQKSVAEHAVPKGADPTAPEHLHKLELSDTEWAKADKNVDPQSGESMLPWIEGQKANILDADAEFIKDAKEKSMPLKSGISGTTFRFMQTAEILGVDADAAKMACVGMLQPIEAHSFHEIATAASGFGGSNGAYSADSPYTPDTMKPLSEEDLTACALEAGFSSLAEANAAAAVQGPLPPSGGGGQTSAAAAAGGDGAAEAV